MRIDAPHDIKKMLKNLNDIKVFLDSNFVGLGNITFWPLEFLLLCDSIIITKNYHA